MLIMIAYILTKSNPINTKDKDIVKVEYNQIIDYIDDNYRQYVESKGCGKLPFEGLPLSYGCVYQIDDWGKFYTLYLRESYEFSLIDKPNYYIIGYKNQTGVSTIVLTGVL